MLLVCLYSKMKSVGNKREYSYQQIDGLAESLPLFLL